MGHGWVLWRAGAEPRLWVVELDPMVAGINADDEVCGGRGSVVLRTGVVVHGRSSGGVLGAPADVLRTVTLSDAAEVGSSHGSDEAQWRRASVEVAKGARGGNR